MLESVCSERSTRDEGTRSGVFLKAECLSGDVNYCCVTWSINKIFAPPSWLQRESEAWKVCRFVLQIVWNVSRMRNYVYKCEVKPMGTHWTWSGPMLVQVSLMAWTRSFGFQNPPHRHLSSSGKSCMSPCCFWKKLEVVRPVIEMNFTEIFNCWMLAVI